MRKLAILGALFISGCGSSSEIFTHTATTRVLIRAAACQARDGGQLPDPNCTPGIADPHVTQENIQQTICRSGYTKTVRPPVSYTDKLKEQQIALYGYADKDPHAYEEDHLISLELGGSPTDPKNLWPEYPSSPNPKDKIENLLHKRVCSGQIMLKQAQQLISHDWTGVH